MIYNFVETYQGIFEGGNRENREVWCCSKGRGGDVGTQPAEPEQVIETPETVEIKPPTTKPAEPIVCTKSDCKEPDRISNECKKSCDDWKKQEPEKESKEQPKPECSVGKCNDNRYCKDGKWETCPDDKTCTAGNCGGEEKGYFDKLNYCHKSGSSIFGCALSSI